MTTQSHTATEPRSHVGVEEFVRGLLLAAAANHGDGLVGPTTRRVPEALRHSEKVIADALSAAGVGWEMGMTRDRSGIYASVRSDWRTKAWLLRGTAHEGRR